MLEFLKPKPLELSNGKKVKQPFNIAIIIVPIFIFLLFYFGRLTNFSLTVLLRRGHQFFAIIRAMFPINFSYLSAVINPMIATISMSFLGTVFAAVLSIPLAYLSSSNMNQNKILLQAVRFVMGILRTLPVLIVALILTYIFGVGTFAGTLAIFVFTLSIITKMFYEQIEDVDMGPFEALESSGASRVKCFFAAVMPQLKGQYISNILYNFEMNVRNAAILGYVGAGGIGLLMNEKIGWREYDKLIVILIVLLIVVVIIESVSRVIRKKVS